MPKRILIADDEPNIVTALEFLLQNNGFAVEVARNGEEALERVETAPPDLVLLDVMMPRLSGFDVCRRIRANAACNDVKIIMLSARGRQAEVEKGLALGADVYMVKPFSTKELVERIHGLVGPA